MMRWGIASLQLWQRVITPGAGEDRWLAEVLVCSVLVTKWVWKVVYGYLKKECLV